MTYVFRKTRIIVSGFPDESSAEYQYQAFRKRSDGRLKNYASCDDLRAWINDNCVKNEYLLDLMSKSEFLGDPPFALYGRFIPVPILFKLLQNENGEKENEKETIEKYVEKFNRIEWEKNQAQKNLLECTCLLNSAIRKLERLENILETTNSEKQIARAKEIKEAFRTAREACSCSDCQSSSISSWNNVSNKELISSERKPKGSDMCNELMRKISELKRKLNEAESCRCLIIQEIQKVKKQAPSYQVNEFLNREDQDLMKKLQKESEKLIAEKGRLLSEMYHALNCLNSLKISSRASFNAAKRHRSSDKKCGTYGGCSGCKCGCNRFDNYESTDTDNTEYMGSTFGRYQTQDCFQNYSEPPEKLTANRENEEPERLYRMNVVDSAERRKTISDYWLNDTQIRKFSKNNFGSTSSEEKLQKEKSAEREKKQKTKKPKVKFFCDSDSYAKKPYSDDLSAFENSLTSEQKAVISKAIKSIKNARPSTTPTTKRENRELFKCELPNQTSSASEKISLRRVKSETMIKEFERTLRNYEHRLNNLDFLESKLQKLRQKSLETDWLKKKLAKVKAQTKKQMAAKKEKFTIEIARLCSENWELRKRIQELSIRSDAQCKKIQVLKCDLMKTKELECETEELKKELLEYRCGFEHQRNCISKWESVVAMQKTEIENLMNCIRKLTAGKEEPQCHSYQEKKLIQRSRSYSLELEKEKSKRKILKEFRPTSEEDENICCCKDYSQIEERKKIQPRSLSRGCICPRKHS